MKGETFAGGLRWPASDAGVTESFLTVPLAEKLVVPMGQHDGTPLKAGVKKKAELQGGDLLGESETLCLYSPAAGSVTDVIKQFPKLDGTVVPAVAIARGEAESSPVVPLEGDAPSELAAKAGIVDSGRSPEPLSTKLMRAKEKGCSTLLINGVEWEAVLSSKRSLMRAFPEEIAQGIGVLKDAIGAETVMLAVSTGAEAAAKGVAEAGEGIEVTPLPQKHPQSLDELLVKGLWGKEIPAGRKADDLGILVLDLETALHTKRAVVDKQACQYRYITVTGTAVPETTNVAVPLGTPVREVLRFCKIDPTRVAKIAVGGPLMGPPLPDLDMPVTWETNGLYVLDRDHVGGGALPEDCFKCGACVRVCPMNLMPFLIAGFSQADSFDLAENNSILSCVECGCCAYVCPAQIPMVQWIQLGKSEIRAERSSE
ncbi:RnfABCDGE type electron transport complex subunit C [Desulfohalobium retbaense]|uniref:Ion-translocating oxidoreductase complex subunit C n=1 Tax=Desulfohalobium retbaense (strain ATCC 49708 / DSM 5692 / JCM 16813 / HR100) TaxID=485915 RepID=C8WYQ9_DESRD|nr:RnfABCDGE type electron transport complex subunit C [Desulfohalobium retbaense]ACV67825.1 electron transport complex, RnfABCDGE type, C subunit [Desulfohalobium retbaense DSM 5692]